LGKIVTLRVPCTVPDGVLSAVIMASPGTDEFAVTIPELLTDISDGFELRQVRFDMRVADLIVPSASRMFATN
jgi:hypothetical protein